MLYAPQYILSHLQQYRVSGIPVQVHNRLDELGPQRVAGAGGGHLARAQVVHFGSEAVLPPHAVVVEDYAHGCVALAWRVKVRLQVIFVLQVNS